MIQMYWAHIEGPTYSICFVAVFLAVAIWESLQPIRQLSGPAERRWKNHGAMFLIGAVFSTVLLRSTPVALAIMVSSSSVGLLNKLWIPLPARAVIAILLLDAIQYWIHRSFHGVGLLWRIHKVHHSDPDYDVSTAGRFHPLEVVWTQALHLGTIAVLAPPPVAVFISVLLTVTLNLTTHANASVPFALDRLVRLIFVTPGMHRIHHSQDESEQQRNYGQTFAFWDRLFGTYTEKPVAREADFKTGLDGLGNCDVVRIGFMLAEPFQKTPEAEPVPAPDPPA